MESPIMKRTSILATLILLSTLLSSINLAHADTEKWPDYQSNKEHANELNERFSGKSGTFHDTSYKDYLQDYKADGDYLKWGVWRKFFDDGEVVINKEGLPQIRDGDNIYWNAVTLSHFALTMHGRYINGDKKSLDVFIAACNKLMELQAANGGFPYPSRPHRHNILPDGWISAMAQGNALSAFARALQITKNPKYRTAGEKAFSNLLTLVENGGARTSMADLDPSLGSYIFFPEYPNTPIDYTLNGYMFTLLGVHDWSTVESKYKREAESAFDEGMKTLNKILPYYDVDGFSTYDLGHIILDLPPYVASSYLGIHVYLLHALNSIQPNDTLKNYESRWTLKIDEMNKPLRISKIQLSEASPQPVGKDITISLDSQGGSSSDKIYKIDIRYKGTWTTIHPFIKNNSFTWTPDEPGEYVIGFFAKNSDSNNDYDNFRYQPFTITAKE